MDYKKSSFKEIDKQIQSTYYNSDDDTIKNFLVPILKRSKEYKRETYSFSSAIFSLIDEGLIEIIKNKCTIKYIVGIEFNNGDLDAIEKGLNTEIEIIENEILKEFGQVEQLINGLNSRDVYVNRLKILSYLISKKILEIKVGFVSKRERIVNPYKHKFHPKIMIFTDFHGNTIVTNGSTNESFGAHKNNEESFDVFKSWNLNTKEYYERHINKFDEFWKNKSSNIKTLEINDLVQTNILNKYKHSFKNVDEIINLEKELNDIYNSNCVETNVLNYKSKKNLPPLRDYQKQVIDNWFKHNFKGIFELATGAGKTITAISTIDQLLIQKEKMIVIIITPYRALSEQWLDVVSSVTNYNPVLAYENKKNWYSSVKHKLLSFRMNKLKQIFIITTLATYTSKDFQKLIEPTMKNQFIIVDECHHVASKTYNSYLNQKVPYRLGLSATPENESRPEGNKVLYDFFKEITPKKYTLKNAIEDKYLSEYDYFPIITELDEDEKEEYEILLSKILNAKKESNNNNKLLELYEKRDKILDNSKTKLPKLDILLNSINDLSHCIIYCSGNEQLLKISEMLKDKNIIFGKITAKEDIKIRKTILDNFKSGKIKILLGIRVLDEGLDLPSVKTAIILKSSSMTRQAIQRRGRCLRLLRDNDGEIISKDVQIYDFVIIPKYNFKKAYRTINETIIDNELKRVEEFVNLAKNKKSAIKLIKERDKLIVS